jgi:hypothetical protein
MTYSIVTLAVGSNLGTNDNGCNGSKGDASEDEERAVLHQRMKVWYWTLLMMNQWTLPMINQWTLWQELVPVR